jgi:hypothetical protein
MAGKVGARGSVAERFEQYSIPEPNSGCTLWFGTVDRHGYGQLRVAGKLQYATHVALSLSGRPIPAGKRACHHCDNPGCANADHLFIGDQASNVADMLKKGRQNHSGLTIGWGHNRKSSELRDKVMEMAKNGGGPSAIGRALGMTRQTAARIIAERGA